MFRKGKILEAILFLSANYEANSSSVDIIIAILELRKSPHLYHVNQGSEF